MLSQYSVIGINGIDHLETKCMMNIKFTLPREFDDKHLLKVKQFSLH